MGNQTVTEPVGRLVRVISGAEKITANCTRRSPDSAPLDAGSIPAISTSSHVTRRPRSPQGAGSFCVRPRVPALAPRRPRAALQSAVRPPPRSPPPQPPALSVAVGGPCMDDRLVWVRGQKSRQSDIHQGVFSGHAWRGARCGVVRPLRPLPSRRCGEEAGLSGAGRPSGAHPSDSGCRKTARTTRGGMESSHGHGHDLCP